MANDVDMLTLICGLAEELCGLDVEVTGETRPFEDLALDSLDEVELAMEIEEALALDLPHDVFEGCETIADMVRAVEKVRHG